MLQFSEHVDLSDLDAPIVDTCGTGGDGAGTVNVSTMAAIVAAASGACVAKHGGRAASSKCGSVDVLESLGVVVDLGPEGVGRCVREVGIGFCFAQRFHPAMRFAAPVRREIGVPTTFNFLGPLANPAGADRRTIGVSDPVMAERVIRTLATLGVQRALVFFGHDGLDELTVTTTSTVYELEHGEVRIYDVDPLDLGIPRAEMGALAGGDAAGNAQAVHQVFAGATGPIRDIVTLNAAAALVVADVAPDLGAAVEQARAVIDDGRAAATLEAFVRVAVAAREGGIG
jgi:anthranilate phosphoribosyltransferase